MIDPLYFKIACSGFVASYMVYRYAEERPKNNTRRYDAFVLAFSSAPFVFWVMAAASLAWLGELIGDLALPCFLTLLYLSQRAYEYVDSQRSLFFAKREQQLQDVAAAIHNTKVQLTEEDAATYTFMLSQVARSSSGQLECHVTVFRSMLFFGNINIVANSPATVPHTLFKQLAESKFLNQYATKK